MNAHQLAPNTLAGLWVVSIHQLKAEQSSDILKQPCWHKDTYFCEGKQVTIFGFWIPNSDSFFIQWLWSKSNSHMGKKKSLALST